MGNNCFGPPESSEDERTPDTETRRRLQEEAAMNRRQKDTSRGIKDPQSVRRQQDKDRVVAEAPSRSSGAGLRWNVG
jgi:small VCP/p97-interacting protein